MTYRWRVPGAAEETEEGWRYELLIQKQPGARTVRYAIEVTLPEAPSSPTFRRAPWWTRDGAAAGRLVSDLELRIGYRGRHHGEPDDGPDDMHVGLVVAYDLAASPAEG